MNLPSRTLAVALLVAAPTALAGSANAAPISGPLSLHEATTPALQTVQWRGRGWGWGGRGWGWGGAAAGLAAGAIVGGAIAATQPYAYGYDYAPDYYGYDYAPGYTYAPGYAYSPGYSYGYSSGGGDAAYCAQRYRSYDPASGTYLGYDGIRHPCP